MLNRTAMCARSKTWAKLRTHVRSDVSVPPSGNKNICHATDFPQRLRVFLLHPAFQHGAVGPGTERRCWRGDLWRTSRNVARWEQRLVDFWTPVPAYLINQPRSYRKIHSSILQRWIG